jgi:hypothetical protein
MSQPSRFKFKLPKKLYGKVLSSIKTDLEAQQPLRDQGEGEVWRKPILTNYGCACFHFNDEQRGAGFIQIALSTVPIDVDYTHPFPNETAEKLRTNAELMEQLSELQCGWESDVEHDISLDYDYPIYEDDDAEEKRLTVYINDVKFESKEILEDLEAKIDSLIEPLKSYIVKKPRTDLLLQH